MIIEDIVNAVAKYEPRIIMTASDVTIVNDIQVLHIYITYVIKETGEVNEYNLDIKPEDNPY